MIPTRKSAIEQPAKLPCDASLLFTWFYTILRQKYQSALQRVKKKMQPKISRMDIYNDFNCDLYFKFDQSTIIACVQYSLLYISVSLYISLSCPLPTSVFLICISSVTVICCPSSCSAINSPS